MAEIDLDLIAKETVVFKFQGKTFAMQDPTMEHFLRHSEIVEALEDARLKAQEYVGEDGIKDQEAFDKAMEKFRDISKNFDKKIFSIFVPGLEDVYDTMTPAQKNKVMEIIFPPEEKGVDEKKIQEDPQLAGEA